MGVEDVPGNAEAFFHLEDIDVLESGRVLFRSGQGRVRQHKVGGTQNVEGVFLEKNALHGSFDGAPPRGRGRGLSPGGRGQGKKKGEDHQKKQVFFHWELLSCRSAWRRGTLLCRKRWTVLLRCGMNISGFGPGKNTLPEWRNGRRSGLKIRQGSRSVGVRFPPPAPRCFGVLRCFRQKVCRKLFLCVASSRRNTLRSRRTPELERRGSYALA